MERKDAIRMTGSGNFYDGMITCSTLRGKAVCRLVWDMNKAECDDYLEKALSGIPENFSGKLLEVPVGTGILTMPVYRTLPNAEITCLDYSPDERHRVARQDRRLRRAVFFAAGVFYYFLKEQVRTLVQKMADAFPGGVLVFDTANEKAVRLMLKTWIKDAEIKDVGAYFAVSDAKAELSPWDSRLRVSSRGYMLGYTDGKPLPVSGFFRFLSKVGDGMMKMQIVKIAFGE